MPCPDAAKRWRSRQLEAASRILPIEARLSWSLATLGGERSQLRKEPWGGRGSAAHGLGEPGQPVRGGQAVGKGRSEQEQPASPLAPVPPAPVLAETLSDVR